MPDGPSRLLVNDAGQEQLGRDTTVAAAQATVSPVLEREHQRLVRRIAERQQVLEELLLGWSFDDDPEMVQLAADLYDGFAGAMAANNTKIVDDLTYKSGYMQLL